VNISIKGLGYRYSSRGNPTFSNLMLESPRGEALAIIGRSGCGKSTLLHIIAGLNRPTEGTMHFDDKKIEGPSSRWVMMFQAPHLFPWMKVSQNVGVGLGFAGWPEKEKAERVAEALKLVELSDYADTNVQDLSGGQQQRVALARALTDPRQRQDPAVQSMRARLMDAFHTAAQVAGSPAENAEAEAASEPA
jgi:NitT/TauT family transport system ATP-binding protein